MAETPNIVYCREIPDVILSIIFSLVTDTRARNAVSLVCIKWHLLERSTRTSLTLRGNIRDLVLLPTCFRAVTHLDLSCISPWGYPLLDSSSDPPLIAQHLRIAFPSVVSLTVYARNPFTLGLLAPQWPNLLHVKLIRWHPRPPVPPGADFLPLFEHGHSLSSLDLSNFYCWTEDLPPALQAHPSFATSLSHLNILRHSFSEGFKSHELLAITAVCPNLQKLLATCTFDHRFIGFVSDETLLSLVSNCPRLSLLHLDDTKAETNDEGYTSEDARITHTALIDVFSGLPLLEDLVLNVCHNVRDAWQSLELLNSKCPRMKSLKLGQFHGICRDTDSDVPNGIAVCVGLESLSIENSADLTDSTLVAISHGCPNLSKFEVQGCNRITETGISTFVRVLQKTLVNVKISDCRNLNAASSLDALEPIRTQIKRLHVDCVWGSIGKPETETASSSSNKRPRTSEETGSKKKSKYYSGDGNEGLVNSRTWTKLECLSLRIAVGESLNPLTMVGLDNCPVLEEIRIKTEGDCRQRPRPYVDAFRLSSLAGYPKLSRMELDCGSAIGYALTAPLDHADLSLWERFFLMEIADLNLSELNYWPPQDMDVNQRSLLLPAAGLLAQCRNLRKLFIHGTAHEHFMMFLLQIPTLRDVQLREDYYPAPEDDSRTEMRVDSCYRFEDALNRRQIPD
ncbi:hypothetical protein SLEP1_g6094 [Rubroshorea leprosula]|uniref:COI1 F-box domain-containing protein n=1 Tax=Rubroshorea leprosula TaxID=152421 RepID=A0AAV5I276_9ROSI|nr:hypothetical protein SLEP1_g6094 [Rubroshorea leprosula]